MSQKRTRDKTMNLVGTAVRTKWEKEEACARQDTEKRRKKCKEIDKTRNRQDTEYIEM